MINKETFIRILIRTSRMAKADFSIIGYIGSLCERLNQDYKLNHFIQRIDSRKGLSGSEINWGVPINERSTPDDSETIQRLTPRTEADIKNLYDALDGLLKLDKTFWDKGGLSELVVLGIHRDLMKPDGGKYKDKPNDMFIIDPNNDNKRIDLKTSPVELAKPQLNALITWAGVCFRMQVVHPFYIIGIFSYEFLRIHPFADGNGRTVRALIILMLIQHGYNFPKYASLERYFEANRKLMFACLISTPNNSIKNWITFILSAIDAISLELDLQAEGAERA
jgi:hypothetical protein